MKIKPEAFVPHTEPMAYSIEQAVRVTSIGRTSIYALIKQGRLQIRKIGNRTLIPADALRALINGEQC